jgi:hypothetical protein
MVDFLLFRKMLTPILLQFLFWISVVVLVVAGIVNIYHHAIVHGLQIIILGPIVVRIFCEFLIIFFKMNDTLLAIKNAVQEKT